MSTRYPADDARDAIALTEACILRDPQAVEIVTANCDLLGVVEILVSFYVESLKVRADRLPPLVVLANLRYGFAEAFKDEQT